MSSKENAPLLSHSTPSNTSALGDGNNLQQHTDSSGSSDTRHVHIATTSAPHSHTSFDVDTTNELRQRHPHAQNQKSVTASTHSQRKLQQHNDDEVVSPQMLPWYWTVPTNNAQVDMVSIHEEMNEGGEAVPFLKPGSVAASTFTLACISLGVGIFVLPSVFTQMGIVLGSLMVCGFAILSNCAILLLLQLAERHCFGTFEEIMEAAFGKFGRASVSFFLATTCCIGNAGHLQFTAQLAKDLFQWFCSGTYGHPISTEARGLLIFAFGAIMMPFCFARTLNSLRYMSTAAVFYVTTLCTLCSCYAIHRLIENGVAADRTLADFRPTVLLDSCPVIAFAYSSIINFFHVYSEIKDKTQIRKCLHISTGLCCAFYLGVALIGSLAFSAPTPDYLYSFPAGDKVITCACVGLMIVIILLYPVINFPLVAAVDAVLYPTCPTSFKRRRIYSVIVLGVIVTLDVAVPNIEMVFGLAGALGLGMIAYALPSAAYLRLASRPYTDMGATITPKRDYPRLLLGAIILLIGLTMAIGSTSRIIYKASTQ